MIYFSPFIIKHHGYIGYRKYILGVSREYATGGKKPFPQRAKVIAAAAAVSPAPAAIDSIESSCNKTTSFKSIPDCLRISDNHKLQQIDKQIIEKSNICNSTCHTTVQSSTADEENKQHCNNPLKGNSSGGCTIFLQRPNKYFISPEFKDNNMQNEFIAKVRKVSSEDIEIPSHRSTHSDSKIESTEQMTLIDAVSLDWHKQVLNLKLLPQYYMNLAKIRLTGLVVLTTVVGYGMASAPFEPITFSCAVLGTAFTSAAANAINQFLEVPYDSQMARTKNRVLVRGLLTPLHAVTFATCCATVGLSILYCGVNGVTAALGAANLALYTSIYTPMKRCSILNTWVGSIVGAIPPLMGWTACTGSLSIDALLMGAILYSWQFPHFNALSWNLRPDYSRAGYRMMSVINPTLCRRTALRHSIVILLLCSASPLLDLTTWTFAIDSLPLNCYLVYRAWQFHQNADSQSSRKLFRLSLIHLPALMFLMFIGKKHIPRKEDECNKQL